MAITFDRVHVVTRANAALEEVRRAEPTPKRSRWMWQTDKHYWTTTQIAHGQDLSRRKLKTAMALRRKEDLPVSFAQADSKAEAPAGPGARLRGMHPVFHVPKGSSPLPHIMLS